MKITVVGTANLVHAAIAAKAQDLWRQAGFSIHSQIVEGPGFWQTAEIEELPALVDATLATLSSVSSLPSLSSASEMATP